MPVLPCNSSCTKLMGSDFHTHPIYSVYEMLFKRNNRKIDCSRLSSHSYIFYVFINQSMYKSIYNIQKRYSINTYFPFLFLFIHLYLEYMQVCLHKICLSHKSIFLDGTLITQYTYIYDFPILQSKYIYLKHILQHAVN